ncbi:glycosyltransferase family 4 protein [Patescibacteria group bacterium]|nr:glycosyltransferase family 4 protein [Patescibacteria group bacterium]
MRILFVLEYYYPNVGGVETLFKNLAEGLAKEGHHVCVVTSKIQASPFREKVNGVEIVRVFCPNIFDRRYWFTFTAIPKVLVLARKYDIVHTTTYNAIIPAKIASVLLGKPIVLTVLEVMDHLFYKINLSKVSAFFHWCFERLVLRFYYSKIIAISDFTKSRVVDLVQKKMRGNVVRVYHGLDYNNFCFENIRKRNLKKELGLDDRFVFLYFGRPGFLKGVDMLVDSFNLLSKTHKDVFLLLILSKKPLKQYKSIQNKVNVSENKSIKIIDSVPYSDLPSYIHMADRVVIPSISEGFGYTAAEACTLKKPVIVNIKETSLGEVVGGAYTQVIQADIDSLFDALLKSCRGEFEYAVPKRFEWKDTILTTIKLYKEII